MKERGCKINLKSFVRISKRKRKKCDKWVEEEERKRRKHLKKIDA